MSRGRWADPISAANSTHNGSIRDAGGRGTDSSGDHQDFSNPMITCRSVLAARVLEGKGKSGVT